MVKASQSHLLWFNTLLRKRHNIQIKEIVEDLVTGKVTVKIEATGDIAESERRFCRHDQLPWTLRETLEWQLNEKNSTYNWTYSFWQRDF